MFERFTDGARQTVSNAWHEVCVLKHELIDAEHLLLGLLRENDGVAPTLLAPLGLTLEQCRARVVELVGAGTHAPVQRDPFGVHAYTERAKKLLELALREALALGHNYIAPEHIMLALLRTDEGVAARILDDTQIDRKVAREWIHRRLTGWSPTPARTPSAEPPFSDPHRQMTGDAISVLRVAWEQTLSRGGTHVTVDSLLRALLAVDESPGDRGLRDSLFEGAWPLLSTLVRDVEAQLGRQVDAGDLLILLGSIRGGLVSEVLVSLEVDVNRLVEAVERARAREERSELLRPAAVEARIREVCAEKEAALEAKDFERAARLRDEERRVTNEWNRINRERLSRVLDEVRARLAE